MRELLHTMQLTGHKAVVVGAGRSGLAAVRLLLALGATVRLLDKRTDALDDTDRIELEERHVVIRLGEHASEDFAGADMVVLSPGVRSASLMPFFDPARPPQVLAELELASWFADAPIIAITGTNGKTTVTTLVGEFLRDAGKSVFVGGNIGTPLSDYILSDQPADVIVLEVSSFQLQNVSSFHPKVSILLNFTPDHLDWHEDIAEYFAAKLNIFSRMDKTDLAILPFDLKEILENKIELACKRVYFTATNRFQAPTLPGRHNQANLEAAWLAVKAFGLSQEQVQSTLNAFPGLPHRIEHVGMVNNVTFINDSKSTTIDSMRAALESVDTPTLLLAGGVFKGGDLDSLTPLFKERLKAVGLFGDSRNDFEPTFSSICPTSYDPTLGEATRRLFALAEPGDTIVLSPGTASFDQYSGYAERGKDFVRVVQELQAEQENS
ncbi:UDP-N-acetylmuramoyl-L-alanine--D-glutamate ligase [Desulfovibrio inopinatus]|uniref:UDP-N-acetylmuramoyl-L-alanine--D-glutamate ligase n=1 Tax=Desulfovibrio inopinatus TaxID=102109 RepID=UPI00040005F0|nr:UDP-N-acetylmuramoyl-L-alanine--D-glutamate ligase [Desulfovibrio inopinatus]